MNSDPRSPELLLFIRHRLIVIVASQFSHACRECAADESVALLTVMTCSISNKIISLCHWLQPETWNSEQNSEHCKTSYFHHSKWPFLLHGLCSQYILLLSPMSFACWLFYSCKQQLVVTEWICLAVWTQMTRNSCRPRFIITLFQKLSKTCMFFV